MAQPIDDGGQRFVDVTDPDSGSTFRFYEIEYSIACAMDGARDLDELSRWSEAELGVLPSTEELELVVSTLQDLGYLEGASAVGDDVELGLPGGASPAAAVPGGPSAGVEDVELGFPGKSPVAPPRPAPPPVGDVELGLPGGATPPARPPAPGGDETSFEGLLEGPAAPPPPPSSLEFDAPTPPPAEPPMEPPSLRPRTKPDADEDGPTNLPPPAPPSDFDDEVSVDLSEHLSLGTADVKEAVRQSKVMQAVSVPTDLLDKVEDEAAAHEAARPGPPPVPGGDPAAPEPITAAEGSKPVELPDRRAALADAADRVRAEAAATKPVEPPPGEATERKSRVGMLLLILLVISAVAGAGWYYMTHIRDDGSAAAPGASAAEPTAAAQPPTAPPPPVADLREAEAPVVEATARQSGAVAWLIEEDSEVEEGEVVAKLRGFERIEARIENRQASEQRYQGQLDRQIAILSAAREAGNQEQIDRVEQRAKEIEAEVVARQQQVANYESQLDDLVVRAPVPGVVRHAVAVGASVAKDAPVVTLAGPPRLTATFRASAGDFAVGGEVQVATPAGHRAACVVTAVDGDQVTVACPVNGFEAGEQATLVVR